MNPNRAPIGRLLLLSLLVACTELSVEAVDVARVVVQPEDAALHVGASMVLSAQPQDRDGNLLAGRSVTWTSSDEAVATVDESGRVTGSSPGTAIVRASAGGRQGEAQVTVRAGTVASVEIRPRQPVLLVGGSVQLTADVRDADGDPAAGPVTWSSSDPGILTVSGGLVSGTAAGAAWVRASAGGVTDSTLATVVRLPAGTVSVTPVSATLLEADTLRFAAAVVGGDGLPVPGAAVGWSTSDPGVAAIDAAGLVTAGDSGQATITATYANQSGTATVRVSLRSVASVTITPSVAGLPVGGTIQLVAAARDAVGTALTGRAVAWSSANAQVASVDASGRVTANSSGSTQISAVVGGVTATAHIAVTAPSVATVEISPPTAQLSPGDTVRLTAVARDARGVPLTGRAVTWSTSDLAVATVDNAGLVRALAGGNVTITGTVAGVDGTAQIGVTAVPVASVTVTPGTAQLGIGDTVQLTATPRDASGAPLSGRVVTWSTSDPGVATVDGSGLVTAVGAGTATITADSEGRTATSAITVAPPVSSVQVTPSFSFGRAGGTVTLTATVNGPNGPLPGHPVVWSSSDTGLASVDSQGLVTLHGNGSVEITATAGGHSDTATILILP